MSALPMHNQKFDTLGSPLGTSTVTIKHARLSQDEQASFELPNEHIPQETVSLTPSFFAENTVNTPLDEQGSLLGERGSIGLPSHTLSADSQHNGFSSTQLLSKQQEVTRDEQAFLSLSQGSMPHAPLPSLSSSSHSSSFNDGDMSTFFSAAFDVKNTNDTKNALSNMTASSMVTNTTSTVSVTNTLSPQDTTAQLTTADINNLDTLSMQSASLLNKPLAAASPLFGLNAAVAASENLPSNSQSPQHQPVEWAAIKVDTNNGKWGEQMMQILHDRVSLQANQHIQEAKIRLDPPDLGKLDLVVRVEGDRLNVQINANNALTREALMQVSDRLRDELLQQHFVHVDVNVSTDKGSEQNTSHQDMPEDEFIVSANHHATDLSPTQALTEHWLNISA